MNTHSCFSAQPCWNTAVARLRAGFTDVLSTGIVMRWITVSMRPIVTPVKPGYIDLRLVLAITNTNNAVKTISPSITAGSLKPPGECAP